MDENPKDKGDAGDFKLKDLLDSSYPLLKNFRDACPGTFKHSQSVMSMIEGVGIALELDVDSLKVMAQYHDIGKMLNPDFFTENQLDDENPHENLDPFVSFQIITRHVSDTVMILISDNNFPRDLIRKMSQHHGSTLLKFFAAKVAEDKKQMFRYETEKPDSIESMLLMICDNIEARSRSYLQSGKEFSPSEIVDDAVNGLMSDGQLDALTLGDLRKIKKALGKELEGTYQKRVSYPDEEEKED